MPTPLKRFHDRENGFTLVELLIVVLIIGILAAIAIPVYLGIQQQAHKTAIRADVNQAVKQVQVAIVEGSTVAAQYGTKPGSEKGETIVIQQSTTTGAGANDFQVIGNETTPSGAVNYSYLYDSVTGKFSDSDSGDIALGGGNPAQIAPTITSGTLPATGTVGTNYSFTVTVSGNPRPTLSATGLPTGVAINATTGVISGAPTAAGTFNYTITATNGVNPDATQSGTITTTTPPAPVINTVALPELTDNAATTTTVPIDVTGAATLTWSGIPSYMSSCLSVAADGSSLTYKTTCANQTFSRISPILTATNGGGTVTRTFYLIERYSASTYVYNNDFTSTGANDFSITGGTATNAVAAPDGRSSLAVTQTSGTTKLTQNTAFTTPSGGATAQYGTYAYVPTGATATMCIYYAGSQEYCASTITGNNTWQQTNNGLASGSTGVTMQVRFIITGAAGKTVYLSNARAVKL